MTRPALMAAIVLVTAFAVLAGCAMRAPALRFDADGKFNADTGKDVE